MDIKLQAYRGESGPDYVDFRKSTGAFIGSPEDEHRTILEARVNDDDLAELGMTETEFFEACASANKLLAILYSKQPSSAGALANMIGLAGHGPVKIGIRAYDND